MKHKSGQDRNQLFFTSFDQLVKPDAFARIIDVLIDTFPMEELGFQHIQLNEQGNTPYHPADLLKLLIYGQRFGIRSANKLHHACSVNVEIIWLLNGLQPSPRTICYFRTQNKQAIIQAHRFFVKKLQEWKLITGAIIALDSTKVRGQNSLKNNFNQKKINRHLEYIDGKMEQYIQQLTDCRSVKDAEVLEDKLEDLHQRKEFYQDMKKQVDQSPDGQISTTDPDARAVIKHRNIVEVGYNIQLTADEKHNLIVDVFTGGVTDRADLALAAKRTQALLGKEKFEMLADKGYYNGADIAYCERKGIRTFIPPPNQHHQKEPGFRKKDFIYHPITDTFQCPAGQHLQYELTFKRQNNRRFYRVKRYGTDQCQHCPLAKKCTSAKAGRKIERPNHQANADRNNARVKRYPDFYRLRQQIVEPIFGVLKRQWHFDHVIHKSRPKVELEVSLASLTYNIMRAINILGINGLLKQVLGRFIRYFRCYIHYQTRQQGIVFRSGAIKFSTEQANYGCEVV
ncbi:MAG: IS1182 family transposase [Bacteroidota bacterium]